MGLLLCLAECFRTLQTRRSPRVNDALSYLDSVRQAFQDNHQVYDMFLDIMKNFKNNRYEWLNHVVLMRACLRG